MKQITLDISDQRYNELVEMQGVLKLGKVGEPANELTAEFFDISMSMLRWAVEERQAGRGIASTDEVGGKYSELSIPCLDQIQKKE